MIYNLHIFYVVDIHILYIYIYKLFLWIEIAKAKNMQNLYSE